MDNERKLPKKAFDSEYMTEFLREVRFLTEKGIKYTFVKKTMPYGISQYKYKKTPALFSALVEFYSMIEAERAVRKNNIKPTPFKDNCIHSPELILSPEQIKQAQEILDKAAQYINTAELKETTAPQKITIEDDTE